MISESAIDALIRTALSEDFAGGNDITTRAIIPQETPGRAALRARTRGVIAGVDIAATVFRIVDPDLKITLYTEDGEAVEAGQDILSVEGSAASILSAERTALNFMTHLSGIATLTRRYVDEVKGTNAKIFDTRKTLPALRAIEKYAVKAGGATNHRFGLYDMVLIKDNHIAIAGGITAALDKVKGTDKKIEIEVDTLDQLQDVLNHGGADIVMLDNMDLETLRNAVDMCNGKIITESSGGVNLNTVRGIAETGVDYISVGALTHSAPALDIGLDMVDV